MRKCSCHSHGGFQLSPEGLAQREFELPGVDGVDVSRYLDKVGSVSGLIEIENDFEYDPDHVELNHRLIHNGS